MYRTNYKEGHVMSVIVDTFNESWLEGRSMKGHLHLKFGDVTAELKEPIDKVGAFKHVLNNRDELGI